MKKIFIQTNKKQVLGALVAKYALEKHMRKEKIPVEIIDVDTLDVFKHFAGKTYVRKGQLVTYDPQDLQSFTLTRFMPPELMGYAGKAIVIDPDIFALQDINELFDMDMHGAAIACCKKKDAWDTSVMLLDCAQLPHWNIEKITSSLAEQTTDYDSWMTLKNEDRVTEIPRIWNSLDHLSKETRMLHTTNRLTQPWKTGLPIDFTRNKMPKIFGIIPREWTHTILGKHPSTYLPHPDKKIETFFFSTLKEAVSAGAIPLETVNREVRQGNIRRDAAQFLA